MRAQTMVAILELTGCTLKGGSPDPLGRADIHDGDHDGYALVDDCDDKDGAVHPDAAEVCDGIDNDCDGTADGPDSVDAVEYWADADADGFGAGAPTVSCTQPSGTADNDLDCDDSRAAVNPDRSEYCGDSIDNDCDAGTTCAWEGEAATFDADATIVADLANSCLGVDVAGTGDVDGDGVGDLLVGSTIEQAFLFLGPVTNTGTDYADAKLTGESAADEHHGWIVLGLEDQAGDGYADIAVSAQDWSHYTGRVYVISGPLSGTMTSDSVASTKLSGSEEHDYFGWASSSGDVDGDGSADLVVSGPWAREHEGDIYVFSGPVSGNELTSADAEATISGFVEEAFPGGTVGANGDVDGDGVDDLLVTEGNEGNVALFLGPVDTDRAMSGSDVWLDRPKGAGSFPSYVVATHGGDIDDDGLDDLAVSAPGEAWIVSGSIVTATSDLDVVSAATTTIRGDDVDFFGGALDSSGDFDADGVDDVVVTAPSFYDGAGGSFVFYGPLSGTLTDEDAGFRIWGDIDEFAGALVTYTGDLDGDGATELAVSSRPGKTHDYWGDGLVTLWYGGKR